MKQNVFSLPACLSYGASQEEQPRRKVSLDCTVLPEHCEAVIPGKWCSLRSSGTRAACWGGRGRKWAQNTNSCTSILLHREFAAKQEQGKGSGGSRDTAAQVQGQREERDRSELGEDLERHKGHGGTIKSSRAAIEKVCLVGSSVLVLVCSFLEWTTVTAVLCGKQNCAARLCLGGDFDGSLASICTL